VPLSRVFVFFGSLAEKFDEFKVLLGEFDEFASKLDLFLAALTAIFAIRVAARCLI
jgi:hypothetical protein